MTISGTQSGPDSLVSVAGKDAVVNLMSGTVLRDNYCNGGAGGAQADYGGTINMYDGAVIDHCSSAITCGGVLISADSTFHMYGGLIKNCTSSEGYAGGIMMAEPSSVLQIEGGKIENCSSGYSGGIFAEGSNVQLSNLTITGCSGSYFGGAVTLDQCGTQTLRKITVTENKGGYGGGILAEGTKLDLSESVVANNYASEAGADIVLTDENSSVTLPDAAGMKQMFEAYGSEDGSDLKKAAGKAIDGWYDDENNARYIPSANGQKLTANEVSGPACLTASCRTKVPLTVTVTGSSETAVYDGTNHQPGITYSYKLNGQEISSLPEDVQIAVKKEAVPSAVNAGTYNYGLNGDSFNVTGANADNYDISFVIAKQPAVTITKRPVKLQVDVSKAGKGLPANECVSVKGDGFVKGEGASYRFPSTGKKNAASLQVLWNAGTLKDNYEIEKEDINTGTGSDKSGSNQNNSNAGSSSAGSDTDHGNRNQGSVIMNSGNENDQKKGNTAATNGTDAGRTTAADASSAGKNTNSGTPVKKEYLKNTVNTGDSSHVDAYGAVLLICAGVCITVTALRKKAENQ